MAEATYLAGTIGTPAGPARVVETSLATPDRIGTVLVRAGIGRLRYTVEPGLYAVGAPTAKSPVLASANYKLSFDHLRRHLRGRDAWILVLDTKGINVWCAAGKGTFGTDELVRQVEGARLAELVEHRKLILPQLGAPGVAAHEVRERTGFVVHYGPVRADDLPAYLDARMKATPEMRRVRFPARDRLVLVPVELVLGAKLALPAAVGLGLLGGLLSALLFLGTYVAANVLFALLLPYLPGRAFAVKGAWLGLVLAAAVAAAAWSEGWFALSGWILMVLALTSFLGLNFTGCTTFTSLSGVLKETRAAIPAQAVVATTGLGLWLVGRFLQG